MVEFTTDNNHCKLCDNTSCPPHSNKFPLHLLGYTTPTVG